MTSKRASRQSSSPRLEGVITGLAYVTGLVAVCVFAVGSFRPSELAEPYWPPLRSLRTDTAGIACFGVATVSVAASEFLRLGRIHGRITGSAGSGSSLLLALARAATVAASVMVVYLSLNTITHPRTLSIQATHVLAWPTEGGLRLVAIAVAAGGAAISRTQHIKMREGLS